MNLNPKIALLSMIKTKVEARQAIVNAIEQSYKRVHLYLIYQNGLEDIQGVPIEVTSGTVDVGEPARAQFWWKKLEWFFKNVKEEYTAIFDADDRYEYRYIEKAVNAIGDCDLVWNETQITVTNDGFRYCTYPTGYGTMLVKTDVFKRAFNAIAIKNDSKLKEYFYANHLIGIHEGVRYYFWTPDMHSAVLKQVQEQCIKEFNNG